MPGVAEGAEGASSQPAAVARRTAVVTGASSGIGRAFARALAGRGFDLVVVARRRERLEELARDVRARTGVAVEVRVADLSEPVQLAHLARTVATRPGGVDLFVAAAGVGTYGRFDSLDPEREDAEVRLDVGALVALTRAVLPGMIARGHGDVVLISSVVAYWPTPFMAVYAASKAFVRSFGAALAAETGPLGVGIVTVCPGPVATEFVEVAGSSFGVRRTTPVAPRRVVAEVLRALDRRRPIVVVGALNRIAAAVARLLPRRLVIGYAGSRTRPPESP